MRVEKIQITNVEVLTIADRAADIHILRAPLILMCDVNVALHT